MRLFSALALPDEVLSALSAAQAALKEKAAFKRWQDLHQAHLTLHFLGEVPDERLPIVEQALAASVRGQAPFELKLGKLGSFGSHRKPNVLWVGVEGQREALVALQANGQRRLAEAGFALDERAYKPHITLAREAAGPVEFEALEQAAALPALSWSVPELLLFRSELRPGGAVHSVIGRYALEGERIARTTL